MSTITVQAPFSALDMFVSAWHRRQPITVQTPGGVVVLRRITPVARKGSR